jgi:DNA (cytosine-5)-methyltransferase 1
VRENARLQSFPDSFVFHGTRTQQNKQVGNAVPPLLGFHIAKQLLTFLNKKP